MVLLYTGHVTELPAPATEPTSSIFKATECDTDKLHSVKFPCGALSGKKVNQERHFCSNPVAENPTGGGTLVKSVNRANQRPLKVHIKMGSDNNRKMNAALDSGLGLEGSPSTTLGSISQESGGFPSLSMGTTMLSPGSILQVNIISLLLCSFQYDLVTLVDLVGVLNQVMTSFPVPCSEVISPLCTSLLRLVKDEVVPGYNKPAKNVKITPVKNTGLVDQLIAMHGDAVLSKPKKIKSGRSNENRWR